MRSFVLTFIGDDRPGFVREIATVISENGGNWLESRMSQLEGKFAGLARVSVDDDGFEPLRSALTKFAGDRFTLSIEEVRERAPADLKRFELDILGHDRPGIVHEVTSALAQHNLNLVEMSSDVFRAAMTGAPTFTSVAIVEVDQDADIDAITTLLSEVSTNLGVDIQFQAVADVPRD